MSDSHSDNASGRSDRPEDYALQPKAIAGDSALLQFAFNLLMLVAFGYLFWEAMALPESRWEPLGAGTFPRMVLGVLMFLNVVMIIQTARQALSELRYGPRALFDVALRTTLEFRLVFSVLGAFALFLLLIRPLGFLIAAFLFAFGVQLLLGPRTWRNLVISAIIALVLSVGLQVLFAQVLHVFLPRGPFS